MSVEILTQPSRAEIFVRLSSARHRDAFAEHVSYIAEKQGTQVAVKDIYPNGKHPQFVAVQTDNFAAGKVLSAIQTNLSELVHVVAGDGFSFGLRANAPSYALGKSQPTYPQGTSQFSPSTVRFG